LKRLAGRTVDDPEVQEVEKGHLMAELADANGQAGVKVSRIFF
jgi:heat shock protein 4